MKMTVTTINTPHKVASYIYYSVLLCLLAEPPKKSYLIYLNFDDNFPVLSFSCCLFPDSRFLNLTIKVNPPLDFEMIFILIIEKESKFTFVMIIHLKLNLN